MTNYYSVLKKIQDLIARGFSIVCSVLILQVFFLKMFVNSSWSVRLVSKILSTCGSRFSTWGFLR